MSEAIHLRSVAQARPFLRSLRAEGTRIGSIHTLGALHAAHGELIKLSATENDHTIVTIYPNKIQLFPGSVYEYDLAADVEFAQQSGADVIISSIDAEMYPPEYATYVDQGPRAARLNSSVFPFASRGQVTGAIRWISLCRPDVSYFGMKDIEQSLLVQRAVADLMMDCEIRHVPCVRVRGTGVPISSRLRFLPRERLLEVGAVFDALQAGREMAASAAPSSADLIAHMRARLDEALTSFEVLYLTVVSAEDFAPVDQPVLPFILHCAITDGTLTHFDGLCIRTEQDLHRSPPVIWLDAEPGR